MTFITGISAVTPYCGPMTRPPIRKLRVPLMVTGCTPDAVRKMDLMIEDQFALPSPIQLPVKSVVTIHAQGDERGRILHQLTSTSLRLRDSPLQPLRICTHRLLRIS